jgi:hypothetical protein
MIPLQAGEDLRVLDLAMFVEPVEISDPAGKLIGLFVPANLERGKQLYQEAIATAELAGPQVKDQQVRRSSTTKEVFEHLLSLTEDKAEREHLEVLITEIAERDKCLSPSPGTPPR